MQGKVWLTCIMLGICTGYSQVVFTEPFDETNGSTTGADNTGGVLWNTSCATCLSGDYLNVQSNQLECEDTNGPASWTTGDIDISSCTGNVQISMTISSAGTMEECTSGCGCNCVDWVLVEYSLNGGAFMSASSSAGGPCAQGCTGGNYAMIGDAVAMPYNFTYCIPSSGSTMQLRVTLQTWAAGEKYRIDDVTVQCFNCVLPVEMVNFTAQTNNARVLLKWLTLTEYNNSHFTIEHAGPDGIFTAIDSIGAAGYPQEIQSYEFTDDSPLEGINYYQVKQVDKNGQFARSAIVAAFVQSAEEWNIHHQNGTLYISGCVANQTLRILDALGRVVYTGTCSASSCAIPWNFIPGMYHALSGNDQNSREYTFFVY